MLDQVTSAAHQFDVEHYQLKWKLQVHEEENSCRLTDLFVHGMLETDGCWKELTALLNSARYLLPCFPWSAQNDPYWGRVMPGEQWIQKVIESHGEPINGLYAHSYGCNATLQHLTDAQANHPRFLVLFAPFYHAEKADIKWQTLETLVNGLQALITESIKLLDSGDRYHGEILGEMADRVREKLGVYGWNQFFQAYLNAPDLPLSSFYCPTLVISGEHDNYCPVDTCRAMAEAMPNAHYAMIPDGGHFLMQSHPAECHRVIRDFIQTLNLK